MGHAGVNDAGWLVRLVAAVGIITILSGAAQMLRPALVLDLVGAESGAASRHFFGIVGMFMALFGGLTLHGVRARSAPALFWAGLQKFGAVAAVALGILHGVFSPTAWPVAGFDFASGILIFLYWRKVASGRV
jgi:hypothetical protein